MASKASVAQRLSLRRGLSEPEAALYVGLGATKFRELVNQRTMPRPHLIGGRRIWDIDDLDAAFKSLPIEQPQDEAVDDGWADYRA